MLFHSLAAKDRECSLRHDCGFVGMLSGRERNWNGDCIEMADEGEDNF